MNHATKDRRGGSFGGWGFLLAVALIYAICAVVAPETAERGLAALAALSVRILPVMAVVFFLLFLIELFIDEEWILRHLSRAAGFRGWALAIGCGVLSAGPLFAWYPLLADLRAKGMSNALLAAFLYSRALKLPLLPLMAHYFGVAYTVLFAVSILVFSVLNGWIVGLLLKNDALPSGPQ
jgi:uncharacterized membrane protein YraQ (UPF0718 family)